MKDVICNILSECCYTGDASHYFCTVDGVEMPYNKIKGKCPFMNYTDKYGGFIDKPEVIMTVLKSNIVMKSLLNIGRLGLTSTKTLFNKRRYYVLRYF